MTDAPVRILIAGDSLAQVTGLSYVEAQIMNYLKDKGYEMAHVSIAGRISGVDGIRAQGDAFYEKFRGDKFYQISAKKADRIVEFDACVEDFKPHIVLSLHDPWQLDLIAYSRTRKSFFWASYLTIETPEYPESVQATQSVLPGNRKSLKEILSRADLLIPYTLMGKKALEKMGLEASKNVYAGLPRDCRIERKITKAEAFGEVVPEENFVFMSMGMNMERKRIDRVIRAFAAFLKKVNNPRFSLHLHTDINAPTGGTDLGMLIKSLDIFEHVTVTSNYRAGVGIRKDDLWRMYAASDAYIGLPSGEGYGYGFIEAMFQGKPVIYTDYGGHVEYCQECGLPVRINDYVPAAYGHIMWGLADIDDAARQMARLVSDVKLYQRLSLNALEISERDHTWEKNLPKLEETLMTRYAQEHRDSYAHSLGLRRIV